MRQLLLLGGLVPAISFCQQAIFPGRKVERPPVIDGVVTTEEWAGLPTARGGYDEQTGAAQPAQFDSEYWLGYDSKFIYIAARHKDPEPKLIKATEYRTNVSVRGDDFMIFAVDPFGTLSDTSQFEINPRGATNIRIAGGRAAKREWLGAIEARGRITEAGWEVEARIPWSIMRLPSPGVRDVRVTFGRVLERTSRAYILDNIAGGKVNNIGVWKAVEVPPAESRQTLKLLPYAYAGVDRETGVIANSGLDLKLPLTSGLDLVGSINPDFRNIERDVLSIDFSYFERLAAESRPFFLEGQNYFGTSMDAPLFASQRIRDFDVGGKVYGKLDERSTIGVLNTVDFGNQNAMVANASYFFTTRTSATLAVADLNRPDVYNLGTFAALNHSMGPVTLYGQHMTTRDTSQGTGHRYNLGAFYQGGGIVGALEYLEISPDFLPRLGFAPERDFRGLSGFFNYVRPVTWGRISEYGLGASAQVFDRFDGSLYRRRVGADGSITMRDRLSLAVGYQSEEFFGFKDSIYFFSLQKPRRDPYRSWQISYSTGTIAGQSYRSIQPRLNLRPLPKLQLSASYQRVNHFDLQEQLILSANYDMGDSDAISGRLIRRNDDTNFYLAFRRAGNKGNEYYLIVGDPNARTFRTSIILKVVMPFEVRF